MEDGYHWVNSFKPSDFLVKDYRIVNHVASFGTYGRKSGQFLDPLGISSGEDFLCIADAMLKTINIYNHTDNFLNNIGGGELLNVEKLNTTKERYFASVFDVTVHKPSNTILVTDPTNKCIHALNKHGQKCDGLFAPKMKLLKSDTLAGICVTNDGLIIVVDSECGTLYVCDKQGEIQALIGREGNQSAEFCSPQFVCWDEFNQRLLVSDTANSRVQVLTIDGKFLFSFGCYGTENGCFIYPSGIDIDEHGRIFVVDQGLHNIQIFDKNGDWLHTIGGPGVKDGCFHSPKSLTILPNGDLFVTDSLNCRIQHFA